MHRPPVEIDDQSSEGMHSSGAACGMELGALRAVDVGVARVSEDPIHVSGSD